MDWLRQPRAETLFTGCGSTYYLSLSAAAIWRAVTGTAARGVPASELWLFPDSSLPMQPSRLVAVSRSAETTETQRAIEEYRKRVEDDYLVITCYPEREMARNAPHTLPTWKAEEESIAQTRSFSSMFLLTQIAAALASRQKAPLENLKTLPVTFDRLVGKYEPLARGLADDQNLQHFVFLGSGANYGLACEAMLKMKEMSLSTSEAFHFMEFRHGPKSVITSQTLITGLISDPARQEEIKVLSEMRALGATVLALSESDSGLEMDYSVELNSGLGYLWRGALFLPVLQLLAYYRSMNKDLDPDRPHNLDAVVKF